MYAQHARQGDLSSAAVPRNYSGNAFRYPPPTTLSPPSSPLPAPPEVPTPSEPEERLPPVPEQEMADTREESEQHTGEQAADEVHDEDGGLRFPSLLSRGIGSEELLLLGMLLLLSGNEHEKNDLPLYLLLLLFCG